MTSSVEDVFADVKARYETDTGTTVVQWWYGAQHLSRAHGWPRIVAVRPSATYAPIEQSSTRVLPAGEKRAVFLRRSRINWHCWGADDEAAEALVTNVALVCKRLYGARDNVMVILGERWPSQEAETMQDGGALAILETEFVFEIDDEVIALPVTAPTTMSHIGNFDEEEVC